MLVRHDDVRVAFNNDDFAALRNRFAGQVEPVHVFALGEQTCFTRVDVLACVRLREFGQHAAAKSNRAVLRVPDRENNPAFKEVVVPTTLCTRAQQAGRL